MDQEKIHATVQAQLAIDLNCTIGNLSGEKDELVFVTAKEHPARRPFPRGEAHFEMLSMGHTTIVSATPQILRIVKPLLAGKGRDEAFAMSFIGGQNLYYLPDLQSLQELAAPRGFAYVLLGRGEIPELYRVEGLHNAIAYDVNHPRPDVLVIVAKCGDRIVAIAGASEDCASMWQIGMDVLPEYRGNGLAAYLVSVLTKETLRCGRVPYYGTASSNIPSQRVAHRAGYFPAWMCCYCGRFEGYEILPTA